MKKCYMQKHAFIKLNPHKIPDFVVIYFSCGDNCIIYPIQILYLVLTACYVLHKVSKTMGGVINMMLCKTQLV